MNRSQHDPGSAAERVRRPSFHPRGDGAIGAGALLRHKRAGNLIAVWREGAVPWVPPEEIVIDDA